MGREESGGPRGPEGLEWVLGSLKIVKEPQRSLKKTRGGSILEASPSNPHWVYISHPHPRLKNLK